MVSFHHDVLTVIVVEKVWPPQTIPEDLIRHLVKQTNAVLVVSRGYSVRLKNICLTVCASYVPLRMTFCVWPMVYMLPLDYVAVHFIQPANGECDTIEQHSLTQRHLDLMLTSNVAVATHGVTATPGFDEYDVLMRPYDGEFCYTDFAVHDCILKRQWVASALRHQHTPAKSPLSWLMQHCQQRLGIRVLSPIALHNYEVRTAPSRRAILIFAFNRPQYFKHLVRSLVRQLTPDIDVLLCQDGAFCTHRQTMICDEEIIEENIGYLTSAIPHAKVLKAVHNLCIAENQYLGMSSAFIRFRYDEVIILEDDIVLGCNAIRSTFNMVPLLDLMRDVICFNMGYRIYDSSKPRNIRAVMPYADPEDISDGCRHLHDHLHYWAWMTTRSKFERCYDDYTKFYQTYFRRQLYSVRPIHKIMADIRRRGISSQHGSQDWTRHACFRMSGMHYHLVPSHRLVVPIGVNGYHSNSKIFVQRLQLDSDQRNVFNYELRMTDICIQHFSSIGVHPQLCKTHEWTTKIGFARWRNLSSVAIVFIPEDADIDISHERIIRLKDEHCSVDYRRVINHAIRCVKKCTEKT